jgi:exopolysaccharide biosynthesis polyprenyl glycosylphosphotransferase
MRIHKSNLTLGIIFLVSDMASICISLYLAYNIRFFSNIFPITHGMPLIQFYSRALLFVVPLLIFVFSKNGLYKIYFIPFMDELVRVVKGVTVGIFFLILTTFFYREVSYSRLTFLLFWIILITLILFYREIYKLLARVLLRRIIKRENLLVIGQGNKMLKEQLKKQPNLQVYYFPFTDEESIDKIKNTIREKDINQVIFVQHDWKENALMDFYDWCESKQVDLKFVPDIVQLCKGEVLIDSSFGIPIFHLQSISFNGFNFYFKRIMDISIAIIAFSIIWPLLLIVIILIKIDSPGPFLYHHKRMGYRGRIFNFYKFRTMVVNADVLLKQFMNKSEREGPVFKMAKDPRITKIGKFLRRFSVDELPQLINVLKGDMSIVGPRPQVLWEAKAYDDWAKRRLRILPGITGLWQISGRASLSYEEMIELDIY